MKNSGDSTHPYRSPPAATVNGRDLTLLTRTQTSDQQLEFKSTRFGHKLVIRNTVTWRPVTSGRQHCTPATLHKAFQEETGRMFSRVRQSMCKRLWWTSKIDQKFAGEWNLVCRARAGTKTALGIIQHWINYFAASFFKALGNVNVHYLKIPKTHRWPHAARVFETLDLDLPSTVIGSLHETFMLTLGYVILENVGETLLLVNVKCWMRPVVPLLVFFR